MQINIDDYILIEDKEDMLYNIFRNLEAVEESTEIKDCVNIEISMSFINESKDLKRHLLLINPEFEKTFFSELNKEEEAFIIEYIDANRSYENVEKMIEKYKEGCILYKINNTRFDKVEETLSEYANLLCIDNENEYISYKELRAKTTANEKFADMVKSSPVRSVEELLSVLKTSVNNTHSSSGTSFGGSSGGSDGGSSGGDRASIQSPVTVTKPVVINNIDFEDITEAEWAAEAITSMAKNGVVSGDGNGKFYPNREMTREEFIKMLVVAAKVYDKDAKCDFDDVEPEKWYYSYIASAMQSDMIYGVSETEFGVGNKLTRQDMAVVCYRAINKIKTLEKIREEKIFNDYQSISDYAKEAVLELYMSGIVNGVDENKFSPFATATRAQGAVIIHNLFF